MRLAVYAADLPAHEFEESAVGAPAVYILEKYENEFAELVAGEMLPAWRAMAANVPGIDGGCVGCLSGSTHGGLCSARPLPGAS